MTDEAPDTSNNSNPITLPDDHPLVKTLAAQKDQVAKFKAAITPAEQLTALQDKAKRFDEHDARAEQLKVRDEVARAKGLTASLLRGSSKEDFEAHADELIAAGLQPAIGPTCGTGRATPARRCRPAWNCRPTRSPQRQAPPVAAS
jgi:hypothetical protein